MSAATDHGSILMAHLSNHGQPEVEVATEPGCPHCEVRPMLQTIKVMWDQGTTGVRAAIWALADGYGEPGFTPTQGFDWSGIRDSSPEAIKAMYAIAADAAFEGLT